jgi:hypothetical protein
MNKLLQKRRDGTNCSKKTTQAAAHPLRIKGKMMLCGEKASPGGSFLPVA